MQHFLSQAGYLPSNMFFIPCSGLTGVNLTSQSHEKSLIWYTGPTLLECLGIVTPEWSIWYPETIEVPSRSLDLPLRISITDLSKGSKINVVNVVGRVESGVLQVGESVTSEPGGNRGTVRSTTHNFIWWLISSHCLGENFRVLCSWRCGDYRNPWNWANSIKVCARCLFVLLLKPQSWRRGLSHSQSDYHMFYVFRQSHHFWGCTAYHTRVIGWFFLTPLLICCPDRRASRTDRWTSISQANRIVDRQNWWSRYQTETEVHLKFKREINNPDTFQSEEPQLSRSNW